MATPSPVYLFKHVKHGIQNIQNDCHQWLSGRFRVHQIRFRPGSAPGPAEGAYSAPSDLLVGLRGRTSKGEGKRRGGKGEKGGHGERKEREGK